jgi:hypothetical protein
VNRGTGFNHEALPGGCVLHSVYFATAKPSIENPDAFPNQEKTLTALASDFKTYLQTKPDAQLT